MNFDNVIALLEAVDGAHFAIGDSVDAFSVPEGSTRLDVHFAIGELVDL